MALCLMVDRVAKQELIFSRLLGLAKDSRYFTDMNTGITKGIVKIVQTRNLQIQCTVKNIEINK